MRWSLVASEQGMHVIRPVMPRLDDQAQIRRRGPVVGSRRRLFIGKWRREAIGGAARAVEHIARIVGPIMNLVAGGEGLHLGFGETEFL